MTGALPGGSRWAGTVGGNPSAGVLSWARDKDRYEAHPCAAVAAASQTDSHRTDSPARSATASRRPSDIDWFHAHQIPMSIRRIRGCRRCYRIVNWAGARLSSRRRLRPIARRRRKLCEGAAGCRDCSGLAVSVMTHGFSTCFQLGRQCCWDQRVDLLQLRAHLAGFESSWLAAGTLEASPRGRDKPTNRAREISEIRGRQIQTPPRLIQSPPTAARSARPDCGTTIVVVFCCRPGLHRDVVRDDKKDGVAGPGDAAWATSSKLVTQPEPQPQGRGVLLRGFPGPACISSAVSGQPCPVSWTSSCRGRRAGGHSRYASTTIRRERLLRLLIASPTNRSRRSAASTPPVQQGHPAQAEAGQIS